MIIFNKIYNGIVDFAFSIGEPRIVLVSLVAAGIFSIVILTMLTRKKKDLSNFSAVTKPTVGQSAHVITSHDIRAIAGEDVIATQLDLARAYIEIGKTQLAQKILDYAIKQGSVSQRQEAHQLLKNML